MAVVVPVGSGLLSYVFSLVGDPEEMVTTVGLTTEEPQLVTDGCADAFIAEFTDAWLSISYTFKGCRLAYNADGTGSVIYEAPRTHTGEAAATVLPQNCALLLKKLTAVGGRSGRGRFYWPPFAPGEDGVNAAGVLSGAAVSELQPKFSELQSENDWRLFHDALSPLAGESTPITAVVLDGRIATQRRRLRG